MLAGGTRNHAYANATPLAHRRRSGPVAALMSGNYGVGNGTHLGLGASGLVGPSFVNTLGSAGLLSGHGLSTPLGGYGSLIPRPQLRPLTGPINHSTFHNPLNLSQRPGLSRNHTMPLLSRQYSITPGNHVPLQHSNHLFDIPVRVYPFRSSWNYHANGINDYVLTLPISSTANDIINELYQTLGAPMNIVALMSNGDQYSIHDFHDFNDMNNFGVVELAVCEP